MISKRGWLQISAAATFLLLLLALFFLIRGRIITGTSAPGVLPRGAPEEISLIKFEGPFHYARSEALLSPSSWIVVGKVQRQNADAAVLAMGEPLKLMPYNKPPEKLFRRLQEWQLNAPQFSPTGEGPWYAASTSTPSGRYIYACYADYNDYFFLHITDKR